LEYEAQLHKAIAALSKLKKMSLQAMHSVWCAGEQLPATSRNRTTLISDKIRMLDTNAAQQQLAAVPEMQVQQTQEARAANQPASTLPSNTT